jgi:Putative MetA-pathway of phenol degradation
VPRVLFVAQSTVGVGERPFSRSEVDPTFKLVWSHDVGAKFGLGGEATIALPSDDGGHFAQFQGSIYATYAVDRATTFFAEYYIIAPTTRAGGPAHSMDFGALHLFGDRVQGDVRIGFGLNQRGDGLFTGAGIAVLF